MSSTAIPTSAGWSGGEVLDEQHLRERFRGFRLHPGMVATYEREAGYLRPEVGVAAHLRLAERNGAVIRRPEEVTDWKVEGNGVRVTTTAGSYAADRLVVTVGPWAVEQLRVLGLPLQVVRIVNVYFRPENGLISGPPSVARRPSR